MNHFIDRLLGLIALSWLFKLFHGLGDAISPSGLPKVHLRLVGDRCQLLFGTLPGWSVEAVKDLLVEHQVAKAVIKVRKDGRVEFSRSVPEELRQRLRNLVLNR